MKLFFLVIAIVSIIGSTSAQIHHIAKKTSHHTLPFLPEIYDSVKYVKIVSSHYAQLTVGSIYATEYFTVILSFPGAAKKARSLKGKKTGFRGNPVNIAGKPTIFITNYKLIGGGGPGCKCLVGDPSPDETIDTIKK